MSWELGCQGWYVPGKSKSPALFPVRRRLYCSVPRKEQVGNSVPSSGIGEPRQTGVEWMGGASGPGLPCGHNS